ncbi:MAG: hypothetical protein JSV84_13315 [Gemmatimonadota bacterium]|nr:MAG: hypothetical protein JSV84_13315 [Gemmatimonadota bacterium]
MYKNSMTMREVLILLLTFLFLFPSCEKREGVGVPQEEVIVEKPERGEEVEDVPTAIDEKKVELKEDLEALIAALENKEEKLKAKESELDMREAHLRARETAVMEKEEKLKSRETASYVVLALGIILIVIVVIIGIRRLPGKALEKEGAAKKREKEAEKPSSQAPKEP